MKLIVAILLLPLMVSAVSFEVWIASHGLTDADALPDADPDGDKLKNSIEFGLANCDPNAFDGADKRPQMMFPTYGNPLANTWLSIPHRSDRSGVRLLAEYSSDDFASYQSFLSNSERGFMRVRATHSVEFGGWSEEVDTRLAASGKDSEIYTTQDHTNATYERNADCWGASIDLTPISPWNSSGGVERAGILISPRHVIFATHWRPDVNATIRFVASDNMVVTRTISNITDLPTTASLYPDISIGVLDSDVPNGIAFAKVLPANYLESLPTFMEFRVPVVTTDKEEKLLTRDTKIISEGAIVRAQMDVPIYANRDARYEPMVSGDSGNPACLVVNGHLVLLCCWTIGGPGYGTFVTAHIDAINTAMTTLGGGYQLTELDL